MPEYLAPAVYVEETPSGNKPIEGVGTSTVGFVGVTERGPLDVPQLVTSVGEYSRLFGGLLPEAEFTDLTGRRHCYLPHAVEAFFVNGGKRAYVTRVLPAAIAFASRTLYFADPALASPGETVLLRAAQVGTGAALNPPPLVALSATNLTPGNRVRIGDGSRAEYRTIAPGGVAAGQTHVSLAFPLYRDWPVATPATVIVRALEGALADAVFDLVDDVPAESNVVVLDNGDDAGLLGLAFPVLIEVGAANVAEYAFATQAANLGGGQVRLTLSRPLRLAYASGTVVTVLDATPPGAVTAPLATVAAGGDTLLWINPFNAAFADLARIVIVDAAGPAPEAHGIGDLSTLPLTAGAYDDYPAGTRARRVSASVDDRTFSGFGATQAIVELDRVDGIVPGMTLTFTVAAVDTDAVVDAVDATAAPPTVTLRSALAAAPVPTTVRLRAKQLTSAAATGAVSVALDDRLGLAVGDIVQLGTTEIATIRDIPGTRGPAPDAGAIILAHGLRSPLAAATAVRRLAVSVDTTAPALFLPLAVTAGATGLLVSNATGYAAGNVVQLALPDGSSVLHRISAAPVAAAPREIVLDAALEFGHGAGSALVERTPLFDMRALDPGAWGNRLWIACRHEAQGLASNTEVLTANPPPGPGLFSSMQLTTLTGIEPGTVIEVLDPDGATTTLPLLKVRAIDRTSRTCLFDLPGMTPAHMAAHTAAQMAGRRLRLRSREFSLDVLLRQRPDPAVPSRDDNVIDGESFRHLSMDPRHSRYIERVLGTTFAIGADNDDAGTPVRRWDRRSEGASNYVRVRDLAAPAAREAIRLGPEALADTLPSGLVRAARHAFGGGVDNANLMGDAMYVGIDSNEPSDRRGIYTLKNLQTVALVAAPGQTTVRVQQALIDHCEEMRYRFAVIDGPPPDSDTLADVQNQRQLYDTKYAALYHPWLTIPDPFPANLANIRQYPVPPSGHVLGVYARVDNERGVHKAPANEALRGLTGLTRYFTKGEQDILNPYPVHVNVIRDFRPNNRGIRVWGARCITSDNDYKYVNVRRLLIFLEDSIDRGLQWVVFEPNAEPLWARVRRSIANFLTTVWRNGALEGTTAEQAFFVKCDRTTMTRDDIDNGRLVCVIGVAPVKPAEFVIVRIGLWTADAA